ncbi:SPOR domain-containing protein [Aromatoleum sp.]|uniref:SPOR domain-containing protein n=1 Tax=Aromatoleum sp. TaxID=2307007 RepID=UPI002FCB282F
MTGTDRVSSLYASVAEAGDDPLRPANSSPERGVVRDTPQRPTDVAGLQDGTAARAMRRGTGSEREVVSKANPRPRTSAAAQAPSRKVLLRRAALAGVAIVLLGVGLLVSEEDAPPPAATVAPGASTADAGRESAAGGDPAGTASVPVSVAGDSEEGVADDPSPVVVEPDTAAADEASAQLEAAPGAASAPASHSDVADAGPAPEAGTVASALPVVAGQPAGAAPSAAPSVPPAPPAASARALARGYVVQLGVFGDPDNAETLSRELAAQAYPAHLQSRVVLGPFSDRQAAKAAAERLRRERKLEGIIVPPRKP